MTKRKDDWQNSLTGYLSKVIRLPFNEQTRHCGIFTGDAIRAMTGKDWLLEGLRDSENLTEMLERVKALGFKDHVEYVASIFPEVDGLTAMPGDIAILPGEGGASLGIVQGDGVYGIGHRGIMVIPRSEVLRWFQV